MNSKWYEFRGVRNLRSLKNRGNGTHDLPFMVTTLQSLFHRGNRFAQPDKIVTLSYLSMFQDRYPQIPFIESKFAIVSSNDASVLDSYNTD